MGEPCQFILCPGCQQQCHFFGPYEDITCTECYTIWDSHGTFLETYRPMVCTVCRDCALTYNDQLDRSWCHLCRIIIDFVANDIIPTAHEPIWVQDYMVSFDASDDEDDIYSYHHTTHMAAAA